MDDFVKQVSEAKQLTTDEQKKAGTPVSGSMDKKHSSFLSELQTLLESKQIDPYNPQTFVNHTVYDALDEQTQERVDLTLQNMAHQVRLIHEFLEASDTPNQSPQLQTMIEQLWHMKQTIEVDHDVFVF